MADEIESNASASSQMSLFPEEAPMVRGRSRRRGNITPDSGNVAWKPNGRQPPSTGSTPPCCSRPRAARRRSGTSCVSEQDRGPDFLRLANALSALYPRGSEEKRLLDGMLLAVPR